MFEKIAPTYSGQVVNAWQQTSQGQPVTNLKRVIHTILFGNARPL